jgi:hypothetical protein
MDLWSFVDVVFIYNSNFSAELVFKINDIETVTVSDVNTRPILDKDTYHHQIGSFNNSEFYTGFLYSFKLDYST